jgi:tetratricopeptide (TPR) repeat protein
MMLGGSGNKPEDILPVINKAVENDPDNVIYPYYLANICFLNAYVSKENTNEFVAKSCNAFKEVLRLKPDYKEAILSLVEIYGLLSAEMGGDKAIARSYAKSLAGMDAFYSARANSVLMEEGADKVTYWENVLEQQSKSARVNEELGKAWFFKDDIEKGAMYMEQAMDLNPENKLPQLNIARAYVMMVMQKKGDKEKNLGLAESAFKAYLDETPDAIIPLKAYAKGWIAKIKKFRGDEDGSKEFMAEAKALDPYFSMAFAVPQEYLYSPPDEISAYFSSYFNPF